MKTLVRSQGIDLTDQALALTSQRVRLTVGARAREIDGVDVLLLGSSETPKQGVTCRVRVRCGDGQELFVEESGDDAQAASNLALWRLEHRLSRRDLGRASGPRR